MLLWSRGMRGPGNRNVRLLQEIYRESPEDLLGVAKRLGVCDRFLEVLAEVHIERVEAGRLAEAEEILTFVQAMGVQDVFGEILARLRRRGASSE